MTETLCQLTKKGFYYGKYVLFLTSEKMDFMKTWFYSVFLVILIFPSFLEAQTDVKIKKSDFRKDNNDRKGLNEAWKHVEIGNECFSRKGIWYGTAYDEYLNAIIYNNSNPELNYKTGVSALFSDNKEEAAGFLLKAYDQKNDVSGDILLFAGRALQYSGKYTEAIDKLEGYLQAKGKKSSENSSEAQKWIEECNSALHKTKDTMRVEIKNLGPNINSNADDYSELLTNDCKVMYFASRRGLPKSNNYYEDSKYDENIFLSVLNSGRWEPAISAGKNLTTKFCETPLYINNSNNQLYICAGYENGGDIKVSGLNKKGEWKVPEYIPFEINTNGSETSFTFSPSGNEIFYVTDKGKDGFGGKDIYYIKKKSGKTWSKPLNAGNLINTAYDEESVRLSKTGDTLWFSSKGHNSIGGFDIFYSIKNKAGEWDTVRNCGYPVNTPWDEIFYFPSTADDSIFYFVSNRSGGFGGLDIYTGHILPPEPGPIPEQFSDSIPGPAASPSASPSSSPSSSPSLIKTDTINIRGTSNIVEEVITGILPIVVTELTDSHFPSRKDKLKDSEPAGPVAEKIAVPELDKSHQGRVKNEMVNL
jgi:hypothetical protein